MIFIHTTCKDIEEAEKLGSLIIENKIGACVDYWPISSCFNQNGKMVCFDRAKLLITTFESKLDAVTTLISENQSETVPLIAGVDVRRINHPYKEWMMEVIS
jgi:periplasmic divalent cation tolerance protein